MKEQILEGFLSFIFFSHTFDERNGLMFDLKFKNMWLVTMFLGCENVVVVVEYAEKLLLPLLMEANK